MRGYTYVWPALYQTVRQLVAVTALGIAMLAAPANAMLAAPHNTTDAACRALDQMNGGDRDASPALAACIASQPSDGVIALVPGQYPDHCPGAYLQAGVDPDAWHGAFRAALPSA